MSCTEIYGFDQNGDAYFYDEVKKSFRGAMAIWARLEEKYLPPYVPEFARSRGIETAEDFERKHGYKPSRCIAILERDAMKEIWDLATSEKIPETDKICLHTTFDKCLVKKEDIPKIITAFQEFDGETSLREQAAILERMYADENCIAVGWNQTSVCADTWANIGEYDEEECRIPYNCIRGQEHYWLFDELSCTKEES